MPVKITVKQKIGHRVHACMKPMYILMLNTRRLHIFIDEAYLSQKLQNKLMRCNLQFEEQPSQV